MDNITLEQVRDRAEVYYRSTLDSIETASHAPYENGLYSDLSERVRTAYMLGFILGLSDAEIEEDIKKRRKGADGDD